MNRVVALATLLAPLSVGAAALTTAAIDPASSGFASTNVTLVPAGSTWRYLDNGSDQGTAWQATGFNDSFWASGPAQLGYGDNDEATVVSYGFDFNFKYVTTYFRHAFTVGDPAAVTALTVRLLRDDGGVVYLNGTEVFRSNMPGGFINYLTFAATTIPNADEVAFFSNPVDPALLVPGTNVLAVEIHQANRTSSDISFDLQLLATMLLGPPVILTEPAAQHAFVGDTALFSVTATGPSPLRYQWDFNGDGIPGATNAALTLSDVTLNDAGTYRVTISNAFGSTVSMKADLTVEELTADIFKITSLTAGGALAIDAGLAVGSPVRGGITASSNQVFVLNTSLGTTRFNLIDLSDATPEDYLYDTVVGDLKTGTVYVLANGSTPLSRNGGTATTLLELDGSTGATNGNRIVLSSSIDLPRISTDGEGIFSGFGRVVLHNGSNVFHIALPSGQVTDLGAMARPPHQAGTSGESWAYFGVAEYFSSALWLVNVRDPQTIVRTRVPDGLTETVATFTNLANMFSFTVWPGLDRWYFEHDGTSQFASGSPVVGFADATFAYLREPRAPQILRHPQNQAVLVGKDVEFDVKAVGFPLNYQWLRNGSPLSSATNAVLKLTGVTTNQGGVYAVVVSNELGRVVSSNALLVVAVGGGEVSRVAVYGAQYNDSWQQDVRSKIQQTGLFTTVDAFYVRSGFPVPTLQQLQQYQAVFVYSDPEFNDAVAMGNVLADYVDSGGGVVLATFAFHDFGPGIEGRIKTGGYLPLTTASQDQPFRLTLVADAPSHPILEGVNSFNGGNSSYHNAPITLTANAELIAHWSNGQPLVAVKESAGGRVVGLNFYPPSSDAFSESWDARTDGGRLMANALNWAGGGLGELTPPSIRVQPTNQLAVTGLEARFAVSASGLRPLSFQWFFNDSPIVQATNATLILSEVTTNQAGSYSVIVSNALGTVMSSNAMLTVIASSAGTFRIATLSTNNVSVVDDYNLAGDDRGGIAVSSQQVFYSGDSSTVRFDLIDLSGGMALGQIHDGLVSELGTEKVYSLAEGANLIASPGGLVTALVELDGLTGEPTATTIPLSRSIDLRNRYGQVGIFAGLGRIVLHDGARAWDIELPSGVVVDLGPTQVPSHAFTENWAYWGVAEFTNGAIWLVYVRDDQTIVRTRVPDGLTSTVATFSSLSDMASITVSLPLSRWYFHHQYSSQFSSLFGTMGFADAAFASSLPPIPPSIIRQPVDQTVATRATVELRVVVRGTDLRYQWRLGGNNLPNATNATLRLVNVTTNQSGLYSVVVSNVLDAVTSSSALLTVVPLAGETFRITSLTTNNPTVVDDSFLIGYDRGGIAASSERVFFTGGTGTAGFDLADLSGGASLGRTYDALVSDLGTEKIYSLSDGTNLIASAGGIVTTLVELDDVTGEPTGTSIALSRPINLSNRYGQVGIFAGLGRIVLHDGGRAWQIDMPSGEVLDLGLMPPLNHQYTDNWAYWGVTEFVNGSLFLAYVRDYQTIVRTRVPDGVTGTLAIFNYLSDMASITVSLPYNRWYFHHEYQSQFSSFYLTMGFADATFVSSAPPIAPSIVRQPVDQTVAVRATVNLGVVARGTGLRYQWRFEGVNLPGATGSTLKLVNVTTNETGLYSVVVSNAVDVVTSSEALLTVVPLTGETFRIANLSTNNATVVDDSFLIGYDRGGIAASSERVFFTGASGSERFDLTDLSGGIALGRTDDALVSDLGTEKIYSLGNGTNYITWEGGVVTTLLALDGVTGEPTGGSIALSRPIDLLNRSGQVGIFAGLGRIVLHDGGHGWDIEMPSGTVLDLGPMPAFNHQFSQSWAYWGVAEFTNDTLWLVYVRDPQTIVRTRVPDGFTSPVSTFNNLSSMASITVSRPYSRWYFHHQYSSQFSPFYQTTGFADAVFESSAPAIAPEIVRGPLPQATAAGVSVDFKVVSRGTALRYQWRLGGTNLPGATNATLTLPNVTANQAGNYSVVVSNILGSVTSADAALTIVRLGGDVFRITQLSTTGARAVEHYYLTSDDRGGVAASSQQLFYSGDLSTARFELADLSGGTALGRIHDGLVSELRSEKVYSLGAGTNRIDNRGGMVTTLLELDDVTGELTGASIPLSRPIDLRPVPNQVGIFSGLGRIVVHDGTRVWGIEMPSGLVVNLGSLPAPQHQFSENWAYWGVAEFTNSAIWLVYVRDSQSIVRTRVPDGLTSTVAAFGDLGDMASITVSLPLNRWYFHAQNPPSFTQGLYETVGYANALFAANLPSASPSIVKPPEDQMISISGTVVFKAWAKGTRPLSYQWLFENAPLPGATSPTLTLSGVSTNRAGRYSVVVTNAFGAVTSAPAALRVMAPVTVAVFDDPNFVNTTPGDMYAGSENVQFSLRRLGHTVVAFTDIVQAANSSSPVLLFPSLVNGDISVRLDAATRSALQDFVARGGLLILCGSYPYQTTSFLNTVFGFAIEAAYPYYSASARTALAVGTAFADDPLILPLNNSMWELLTTTLPVGARSVYEGVELSFDQRTRVALIPHGNGKIIFLGWDWADAFPRWRQDNGWLRVLASAVEESRPSEMAPPVILVQPTNQTVLEGLDLTFAVIANGYPLNYQWWFNSAALPGETNAVLTLHSAGPAQSGSYAVVLSNALGMVTSQVVSATVQATRGVVAYFTDYDPGSTGLVDPILEAGFTPLRIADITRFDFDRVQILMVNEANDYTPTIELQKRLPELRSWVQNGGRLIVHDRSVSMGFAEPNPFLLGLTHTLAQEQYGNNIDVIPPGTTLVTLGPHGTIGNSSLDNAGSSYHGFVLGSTIPAGAVPILRTGTSATQVVAVAYGLGSGLVYYATIPLDYQLERSDLLGQTFRTTYTPNVIEFASAYVAAGPPIILEDLENQTRFAGSSITLNVSVSGAAPLRYQWRFNGEDILGATNAAFVLFNLTTNEVGLYSVEIANAFGSVTSQPAALALLEAGTFKISGLSANGSRVVEHNAVTGDDRGGIALSSNQVFYTGDSQTARFSAADLSGGTALGRQYDALVGNLRTERVYSLANGANLIDGNGGVATSLIEIDGGNGDLTTNRIELSSAINVPWGSGIFAGYDCVALYNGTRVYRIEIPSGLVSDLGAMVPFNHSYCENWAFWGVTEFFNGEFYLVYVQDYQTIVRKRVPDGQTSVVATFANLSDMCSFTFSISRNRWYFHHEGFSQFGGSDESIGYATGAWDHPPRISNMTDNVTDEDTQLGPIPFTILDTETNPTNVVVVARSSDQTLLPDDHITLGGFGTLRSIAMAPATNQNGTALVTITVTDSIGQATNRTFQLTVEPVNDPPSFTAGPDQGVLEDAGAQFILNWARDITAGPTNESDQTVSFEVSNDHPTLFTVAPAVSPAGHLSFTPAPSANGVALVTVRLRDNGGTDNGGNDTSPAQTFTISVPVAPTFNLASRLGNQLTLGWPTMIGRTYRVEYKDDLGSPNWLPFGVDMLATGSSLSTTVNLTAAPHRFFRVVVVQ